MFTAARIDELIACEKRVTVPPAREFREEYRHRRKDFRLEAVGDPPRSFGAFMRQSLEFAEDFSLGLVYLSEEGKRMTLIRFNGQHDQSNDPYDLAKAHFQYHVHRATADNLNNGRYGKHPAAVTRTYASFPEAMQSFLATIGLQAADIARHFPGMDSLPLFRTPGEP